MMEGHSIYARRKVFAPLRTKQEENSTYNLRWPVMLDHMHRADTHGYAKVIQ